MTNEKLTKLAYILIGVAILVLAQQFLVWGRWIDWPDIMHHEFLALGCGALGIGILFASWKGGS